MDGWLQRCRESRKLVLIIVAIALLLDNMLLTTVGKEVNANWFKQNPINKNNTSYSYVFFFQCRLFRNSSTISNIQIHPLQKNCQCDSFRTIQIMIQVYSFSVCQNLTRNIIYFYYKLEICTLREYDCNIPVYRNSKADRNKAS